MPERCEPDDPRRCKAPVNQGQCPYLATDGTDYCENHDGGRQMVVAAQQNYLSDMAKQHLARMAETSVPSVIESLDAEVAANALLLKMTMERTDSDDALMLQRPVIQSLTRTLESLKKTNQDMKRKHGQVLSMPAVLRLATKICRVFLDSIKELPDFEERADWILQEVDLILKEQHNEEGELK